MCVYLIGTGSFYKWWSGDFRLGSNFAYGVQIRPVAILQVPFPVVIVISCASVITGLGIRLMFVPF